MRQRMPDWQSPAAPRVKGKALPFDDPTSDSYTEWRVVLDAFGGH